MIRNLLSIALISAAGLTSAVAATPQHEAAPAPTVVLVHGAFADGSSWNKVIPILESWGVRAVAVQNPLTSLQDDVDATQRAIQAAPGRVVLVGHSWGGTVITQAGTDDKVGALVYVAAFAPDVGQNTAEQGKNYPASPGLADLQDRAGFLWLTEEAVTSDFAQDLMPRNAQLIFSTQGPIKASAFAEPVTRAAWKTKPSWYVIAREDRMIAPQLQVASAQRIGARIRSLPTSHVPMLSSPTEVAYSILEAAGLKQEDSTNEGG